MCGAAMKTAISAAAFSLLAACGSGWPAPPDFVLKNGLAVSVSGTRAEWAKDRPSLADELESTTSAALRFWGGASSSLEGWELVFTDTPIADCGGVRAEGCTTTSGDYMQVVVRAHCVDSYPYVEQTIIHEIGHAVIGDHDHLDPRWGRLGDVFPGRYAECIAPRA